MCFLRRNILKYYNRNVCQKWHVHFTSKPTTFIQTSKWIFMRSPEFRQTKRFCLCSYFVAGATNYKAKMRLGVISNWSPIWDTKNHWRISLECGKFWLLSSPFLKNTFFTLHNKNCAKNCYCSRQYLNQEQ